jgi:hypothetical protein
MCIHTKRTACKRPGVSGPVCAPLGPPRPLESLLGALERLLSGLAAINSVVFHAMKVGMIARIPQRQAKNPLTIIHYHPTPILKMGVALIVAQHSPVMTCFRR